jgi:hypothetical protein
MWECRALLDEMVIQKMEGAVLGKDSGFVVERAVFKVKCEPAGHATASRDLGEVAFGDGFSVLCAQHQKTVNQALGVSDADRVRQQGRRLEQGSGGCENRERNTPTMPQMRLPSLSEKLDASAWFFVRRVKRRQCFYGQ